MRHLLYILPVILSACASVEQGNGNVSIQAVSAGQAVPDADCQVSTYAGRWNVTTPGTVPVGSPNGDLRVLCNKAGYRASEVVYAPSYGSSGSSIGLGIGGIGSRVGAGIGLGVPIGGGNRGGYPSTITVEMNPQ
jgi:hypothetical protein